MFGIELIERKRSEELGELFGFEPVSTMIKKSIEIFLYMLNVKVKPTG